MRSGATASVTRLRSPTTLRSRRSCSVFSAASPEDAAKPRDDVAGDLPAALHPLVEARPLRTDRGHRPVPREHDRLIGVHVEEPLGDGADDQGEVAQVRLGVARPAGEEGVAAEQQRRAFDGEADRSGGVPGRVNRADPKPAHLEDVVVLQELVVTLEHAGVLDADGHLVAGVPDRPHGRHVVPVAVGLDDRAHPEGLAHREEAVVLVRGVDQDGVTCAAAPHDVDVVGDRADDEAVHVDGGILPDPLDSLHGTILPRRRGWSAAQLSGKNLSSAGRDPGHRESRDEMNFGFSEEQEELRRLVRRFLEEKSPETEVRRLMATAEGYDEAVWRQMADQLGLQAMIIPEAHGGAGFGYVELEVVLEEMGAALLCAPYFSTVALATNALLTANDEVAMKQWLPSIASGDTIATLPLTEEPGRWELDAVTTSAKKHNDAWTLSGHKSFVLDGHTAGLILVAARSDAGLSLF